MGLEFVIWLSCTLTLPQDLPEPERWTRRSLVEDSLSSIGEEQRAKLGERPYWTRSDDTYRVHAYDVKHTLTTDDLAAAGVIDRSQVFHFEMPSDSEGAPLTDAERAETARLEALIDNARFGLALHLEGNEDEALDAYVYIGSELAKACGGAVIETPDGVFAVDENARAINVEE